MGLWDTAKSVGSFIVDSLEKQVEKMKEIEADLEKKDDDYLMNILKGGSSLRSGVSFKILKNRGYDEDRLKTILGSDK